MQDDERCQTCRFYQPDGKTVEAGECRRRAPSPGPQTDVGAYWPVVLPDDWCGEWQPDREALAAYRAGKVAAGEGKPSTPPEEQS